FATHAAGNRIERLWGDSASYDFRMYYENIDLFFIDGAHTYEHVRKDTLSALRCVHSDSVIAWHDYGRHGLSRGVTRWLNELARHSDVFSSPGSSVAFMKCTAANLTRARGYLDVQAATLSPAMA